MIKKLFSNKSASKTEEQHRESLPANALQTAMQYHQLEDFAQAQTWYQQILQYEPTNVNALHFLGILFSQVGKYNNAIELINKAISISPASVMYSNLGNILKGLNQADAAIENYQKSLALEPNDANVHYNLGLTLHEQSKLDAAIEHYLLALRFNSNYVQAYYNLGIAFKEKKELETATEHLQQAISLKPDYVEAYCYLAIIFKDQDKLEAAIENFQHAILLNPNYAEAHNNLGAVFQTQGKLVLAAENFQKAIYLKPNYAEAQYGLGVVFQLQGKLDDARKCFQSAISCNPSYAEAYYCLGTVLYLQRKLDVAIENYQKALSIQPDNVSATDLLFHTQLHSCDWSCYTPSIEKIITEIKSGAVDYYPFCFLAVSSSVAEQLRCTHSFATNKYPPAKISLWTGDIYKHNKIRIAYLSADFYNHATAYLMAELFEAHDRNQFELTALSFGPSNNDDMRERLVRSFDSFLDVYNQNDFEIATLLHNLEIDIAVDLKGYTRHSRPGILAYRPAPIQVNYLGYPGTMGVDYIDYNILADQRLIPPEYQSYYTEKVVYLPDSYQVNDSKRLIAEYTPTRKEVNLPETGFVFCCFNNNYKITPDIFDSWMRLLAKVENSVLWLLEDNPFATINLKKEAMQRGIAAERLIFAPRMKLNQHLARHKLADLFLDTLPINAHTTTSDALWAGLPVLTCTGEAFAGRVAASLLNAVGLPELITDNLEEYEALALKLATTPDLLAEIRAKLIKNRTSYPLFDTDRFRRHIESAYITMWERQQRAEIPTSFTVQPII